MADESETCRWVKGAERETVERRIGKWAGERGGERKWYGSKGNGEIGRVRWIVRGDCVLF